MYTNTRWGAKVDKKPNTYYEDKKKFLQKKMTVFPLKMSLLWLLISILLMDMN